MEINIKYCCPFSVFLLISDGTYEVRIFRDFLRLLKNYLSLTEKSFRTSQEGGWLQMC